MSTHQTGKNQSAWKTNSPEAKLQYSNRWVGNLRESLGREGFSVGREIVSEKNQILMMFFSRGQGKDKNKGKIKTTHKTRE